MIRKMGAAIGLAVLCNPSALSAADLVEALSGNTVTNSWYDIYFAEDGQMYGKNTKGSSDKGTWKVDPSGSLCMYWTKWKDRDCFPNKVISDGTDSVLIIYRGSRTQAFGLILKGRQAGL